MATGTRRKGKGVEWTVCIPEMLALRAGTLPPLYDRANNRPVFGARSQLISDLLADWATKTEAELAALAPIERKEEAA